MGRGIRYPTEFKQETVNQITLHGLPLPMLRSV